MDNHHFYPLGIAIPAFAANTLSTPVILAWFCGISAAIIFPTLAVANRKKRPTSEAATVVWFVLCAYIHVFLEGTSSTD